MSNTFTNTYEKVFGIVENRLKKFTVFDAISGKIAQAGLGVGGRYYQYAYDPDTVSHASSPYNAVAFNDMATDEIVIDAREVAREYSFRMDMRDQNVLRRAPQFIASKTADALKQLYGDIDGQTLGAGYTYANYYADDAILGGTAGTPITLTGSNIFQTFTRGRAKLAGIAGPTLTDLALIITPEQEALLLETGLANGFRIADEVLASESRDYLGDFAGMKTLRSSYLTHTIVLTYTNGTDFSNGTVFTLNGLTYTASTTIGSTAGNFLVGSSADASATNLVYAINNPSTTNANVVAQGTFNSANVAKLAGITATLDATANTITIVSKRGYSPLSGTVSTLTGAVGTGPGNGALANVVVHNLITQIGAIELCFSRADRIYKETRLEPQMPVENFMMFTEFGTQIPYFSRNKVLPIRCYASVL